MLRRSKSFFTTLSPIVISVGFVVVALVALYVKEKGASTGGLSGTLTAFIPAIVTSIIPTVYVTCALRNQ